MKTWKWDLINGQWFYVMFFTLLCGGMGEVAGGSRVGLFSFPIWWGIALLARNTLGLSESCPETHSDHIAER